MSTDACVARLRDDFDHDRVSEHRFMTGMCSAKIMRDACCRQQLDKWQQFRQCIQVASCCGPFLPETKQLPRLLKGLVWGSFVSNKLSSLDIISQFGCRPLFPHPSPFWRCRPTVIVQRMRSKLWRHVCLCLCLINILFQLSHWL